VADKGVAPEFSTNGTVITERNAYDVMEAGLSKIFFSMDGVDKETYEKIRVNANYEKVIANFKLFLDVKNKHGFKTHVIAQMIEQPEQIGSKDTFTEMWSIPGVDTISYKFLDSWAGTLFQDTIKQPEIERHACAEPFERVAILVNGDVVACCRDWAGLYIYGNLKEQSLYEIWHGEKVNALRQEHLSGDYVSEPCLSCKEWHIPMNRDVSFIEENSITSDFKGVKWLD